MRPQMAAAYADVLRVILEVASSAMSEDEFISWVREHTRAHPYRICSESAAVRVANFVRLS
jgi:hypothetical protein